MIAQEDAPGKVKEVYGVNVVKKKVELFACFTAVADSLQVVCEIRLEMATQ